MRVHRSSSNPFYYDKYYDITFSALLPEEFLPQPKAPLDLVHGGVAKYTIYFEKNSSNIPLRELKKIELVPKAISDDKGLMVSIEGHASTEGTASYNQSLSQKRAKSVKDYLTGKAVPITRIVTIKSYGETRPAVAENGEERLMALNRRVVVSVSAISGIAPLSRLDY